MKEQSTMPDLPESARRVVMAGRALGLQMSVVEMTEATRTADEAARACGCDVAQIVKSLIFLGRQSDDPYLLLVSGANRVEEGGVAAELGEALRRPDASAVRRITGYSIGGIPPFGHARHVPALFDERLLDFDTVWAAAGTPRCVFPVSPRRLQTAIGARPFRF
jgi:prolyl-tRNA editing enzyme YbaK/EbsC (Cys-tRNA(Pro) deacylase)